MNESINNRLKVEIDKAYYISKRYKAISTFAFLYFEGELDVDNLGSFVRLSDHLLKIDDNHYFINYTFTEHDAAFKASHNLLLYLDKHFDNQSACIALDNFDITKSPTIVINRLTQILENIKKSSKIRIEDENILNGADTRI